MDFFRFTSGQDFSLEVNQELGYARDLIPKSVFVIGSTSRVNYSIRYSNSLIGEEIVENISHTLIACPVEDINSEIERLNDRLSEKFQSIFKNLHEEVSKNRHNRGVGAVIAGKLAMEVAAPLVGKATGKIIDWFFGNKNEKEINVRQEIERSQALTKKWLRESTVELCSMTENMRRDKLTSIAFELLKKLEFELLESLVDIASGQLAQRHGVHACQQLNSELNSAECMLIIRENPISYQIENIELVGDNEGLLSLQLEIPLVVDTIRGFELYKIGVPKIINGQNWLLKPVIPDMKTVSGNFVSFHSQTKVQYTVPLSLVEFDPKFDADCFESSTSVDNECDVLPERVFSDVVMQRTREVQLIATFVDCHQSQCSKNRHSITLTPGLQSVVLSGTTLTCGSMHVNQCSEPSVVVSDVIYNNYTRPLNLIHPIPRILPLPLTDSDHILEQVTIYPGFSLRWVLLISSVTALLSVALTLYIVFSKLHKFKQNRALNAIMAY